MEWSGHVIRNGEACGIAVGKPEKKGLAEDVGAYGGLIVTRALIK
jgi:hypothetical protein